MKPLRIYLCDLTHNTQVLVSDTIPINIAFIASYAKKHHGSIIEISLFKFPDKAIQALKASPPDILALSNYSWNSQLSECIAGLGKRFNPKIVTVQGGPNFPNEVDLQRDFMLKRINTDIYVELEAEVSFSELIGRVLSERGGGLGLYEKPIPGCGYILPSSRPLPNPVFIKGEMPARLKELDEIPSPYLSGMLDFFFDGLLTPFIETTRGCPFKCTFCHSGSKYFNSISTFSVERIVAEIEYIAPRAASLGIVNLHMADTNFGMYERDKAIAEALFRVQTKFGWPRQILATTGKNNKERVIDITKLMGDSFPVTMAVQSMNSTVLKNIQRENIKTDHFAAITKHLRDSGRVTRGEVIVGLPGETRETFVQGLRQMMDVGVSSMCIYSLMLLHGTLFQNPEYRKQYEIKGKFRIVPLNFGEYEGIRVFDYEEVGISTKDMPFEDYLWMRGLSLFVEILYNDSAFKMLFRYAKDLGIKPDELILDLYADLPQAPAKIKEIVGGFMRETSSELWDSEKDLLDFYRKDENYQKLLRGEVGGNLIYKYKSLSIAFSSNDWSEHVGDTLKKIVVQKRYDQDRQKKLFQEIDVLVEFEKKMLNACFDSNADTSPLLMESPYDVLSWHEAEKQQPLASFAVPETIRYVFEYTEIQMKARRDLFKRYGTTINALSKIMTRVGNVQTLFRTVRSSVGKVSADF